MRKVIVCFAFIVSALLLAPGCFGQSPTDSALRKVPVDTFRTPVFTRPAATHVKGDSIRLRANPVNADSLAFAMKHQRFQPNPKKAGMYSSILPGLGQLYNRQYWKIPVVYAGGAIATYFIVQNLNNYDTYRKAYIGRINNPYPTDQFTRIYSTDQLKQLQDDYQKYLDLTVLFSGIGYALQVVDAVVSAHLKNFDMSRDISFKVRPVALPSGVGVGLVVNFK